MMKKLLGMVVCMLVLATCLPVTATINDNTHPSAGTTPFWNKEHTISIYINKIWVFESGDSGIGKEPGEYFFIIFVFPLFKHVKTKIYEVDDEHPQSSYNFGKIAEFTTRFTPVTIIILAIEEDKKDDLNQNEFMDYTNIRFKPPKGDYPPSNPYSEPIVTWKAGQYFEAQISIGFHY